VRIRSLRADDSGSERGAGAENFAENLFPRNTRRRQFRREISRERPGAAQVKFGSGLDPEFSDRCGIDPPA
jgi:hypothetical protein